jgi:hypothetical protein
LETFKLLLNILVDIFEAMLKILWNLAVLLTQFYANCNARNITLGILLPFKTDSDFLSDNRQHARYYAGMIPYAINSINGDPNLLSNHTLNFIWQDTECRTDKALRGMVQQWIERVDAYIGLGCFCEEPARLASALGLPVISNVRHWKTERNGHCRQHNIVQSCVCHLGTH